MRSVQVAVCGLYGYSRQPSRFKPMKSQNEEWRNSVVVHPPWRRSKPVWLFYGTQNDKDLFVYQKTRIQHTGDLWWKGRFSVNKDLECGTWTPDYFFLFFFFFFWTHLPSLHGKEHWYGFGTTWDWIHGERTVLVGWTNPLLGGLTLSCSLRSAERTHTPLIDTHHVRDISVGFVS